MLDLLMNLLLIGGIKRLFGGIEDPMPFGVALLMTIFGTVLGFVSVTVEADHLLPEPLRVPLLFGSPVLLGALLVGWRHLSLRAAAKEEALSEITEIGTEELHEAGAVTAEPAPTSITPHYGWRGFALDAERFLGATAFLLPLLAIRYFFCGAAPIW